MAAGPRMAVVAPAGRLPAWQGRLLERLLRERGVTIVARLEPGEAGESGIPFAAYRRWRGRRIRAERRRQPPAELGRAPVLTEPGSRRPEADWVLHLGPGAPDARWAAAVEHGLWYFHLGSEGDSGYGWGGLAAVATGAEVVAGELRALDQHGRRCSLFRGWTAVEPGFPKTRDKLLRAAAEWPARAAGAVITGLSAGGSEVEEGGSPPVTRRRLLRERRRAVAGGLSGLLHRNFRLDQWAVGLVRAPAESLAGGGRPAGVRWLPEPSRRAFQADPFARPRDDGGLDLLVETFDHRRGSGDLDWLTTDAEGIVTGTGPAIHRPEHQSYPYLFDWQGAVYCQPETAAAGTSRRYRALAFPARWAEEEAAALPAGLVDGTVFEHDGRWWLLGGLAGRGARMQLYAWHAETPLGPWTPHARNPVKCDPRSARPAGRPFRDEEGRLIRPAQDCARGYGRAVVLNRVTVLTPGEFAEEPAGRLEPDPDGPYPEGLHTLCPAGGWTVIDGKRSRWQPLKPLLRFGPHGTSGGPAASEGDNHERG